MTGLLRAELIRLTSRRFLLVTLVGVLIGLAAFQLQVNASLTPPDGAALAEAQGYFEEAHRDWEANHLEWEAECTEQGVPVEQCGTEPQLADYLWTVEYESAASDSVLITGYLVALAMFMVAGSYIGAEYSSGSIANWLTFLPQRGRVFFAKLAVVTLFAAAVSAVATAAVILASLVFARWHDVPITGFDKVLSMGGRGVSTAVILAALGFCIGLVARHTAAAIGVLLGYLFVWFVRIGPLSEQAWAQRLTRWSPEGNLSAIVEKGTTYRIPVRTLTPDGPSYEEIERTLSLTHGLLYWGILLTVVIVVTALVFRRRDVN